MKDLSKLNRRRWAMQLALTTGLALLFLTALLWGLRGVTPARADPGTLYVDGASGQDTLTCGTTMSPCQTISFTLNSRASDGDTILIAAGTYTENLTIGGMTLTLRGGYAMSGTLWLPDSGETVVDGNEANRVFLIHGNNSTLENLTITGGDTPDDQCWGGGVWITNGDVTIRDSLITGNWSDCSGAGLEVNSDWGPAHLTLVDSIVFDNQSGGDCGGVSVWHTGAHLTNTLIVSNTGSNGSALRIENADATVQNGTVADNQGSAAINIYDTDGQPDALTLHNTIAWGNGDTDLACNVQTCTVTYSDVGGGWPGVGNIDADPQFTDPADGDYHLLPWSPCIDTGTATDAPDHDLEGVSRPQNAGYDMGAYEFVGTPFQNEGTRYVATSGSDVGPNPCLDPGVPCQTIGHALAQAGNGENILVAAGTYTETLNVGISVTLKGGYAMSGTLWLPHSGETIVDADGADEPTISIGNDAAVTVENLIVQGANYVSDWGGGFFIIDATVVISDTVIRNNSTGGSGGGLFIEGNAQASLINSTVTANTAANGAAGLQSGPDPHITLENTLFTNNTGWTVLDLGGPSFKMVGGQVNSNTVTGHCAIGIGGSGSSVISGTEIMSNTSQAMIIWSPDNVVSAHNLIIRGNAGGVSNNGILTLTHSIVENNSSDDASVIFSENFSETNRLVLDNCTIRDNSTPGIVGITTGYAEIHNTEIVDNEPTAGVIGIGEEGTTPTVELANVLLADNETQGQTILFQSTGSATLMNVTVAGNNTNGNQVLFTHDAMTATNIILWGNTTGGEDMLGGPGTLSVSYSDIEGGWTGTGNIDANPRFVDAANGDYHLGAGSPCIDAGTPAGAPPTDIEGTPRDAMPDMGAYEWMGTGFRIFLPVVIRGA